MNLRLALCGAALWAAGCSDANPATNDAGTDVVSPQDTPASDVVASDVSASDVSASDVTGRDVVLDAASNDAAVDVTRDAPSSDVTVRDAAGGDVATDVTVRDASGCSGEPTRCASGTAGGACGDVVTDATCVAGAWQCGEGRVPIDQCACVGRPPGACTCGPRGWICDAGVADVGAVDAGTVDCDPAHVACDARPPVCTGGGEVPSVSGACWGPCVVYTRCATIACDPAADHCPTNLVCYRTTRTCGPPL